MAALDASAHCEARNIPCLGGAATEKKSKDGSDKTRKKWEKQFTEAMAALEKADLERLKALKSALAHAATAVIETAAADKEVRSSPPAARQRNGCSLATH